jgi:hypothetical protein
VTKAQRKRAAAMYVDGATPEAIAATLDVAVDVVRDALVCTSRAASRPPAPPTPAPTPTPADWSGVTEAITRRLDATRSDRCEIGIGVGPRRRVGM